MNYRQLEVFRAVMDTGSATAAARLLDLSQPAVSQHLAQLQQDLDLDLFARERGRLVPTEHAVSLYDEVALAFESVERVMNLAHKMRSHSTGTFRIAVPYSFCEALLPRLLARFTAGRPQLRYAVELGSYETIVGLVAKRKVDVGIVKEPLEHQGISLHPLIDSVGVCALPVGHRLAGLRRLELKDIAAEPLILLGQHKPWRYEIQALFRRNGYLPSVRIETHSVGAACGFVAGGLGLAIVPEVLGAQFVGRGIVLKPIAVTLDHRFAVAYPRGLQRASLVAEFARAARRVAQEIVQVARG